MLAVIVISSLHIVGIPYNTFDHRQVILWRLHAEACISPSSDSATPAHLLYDIHMWGVWRPVTICGHCLEAMKSVVACAVCVDCCSILLGNELLALKAISDDGRQAASG